MLELKEKMPLVKQHFAKSIASELVSVQPMKAPTGNLNWLNVGALGPEVKKEQRRKEILDNFYY